MANRIYLDNAATSFPKPEAVYDAVEYYSRQLGAAVGRSEYRTATEVQTTIERCRKKVADFLGAESPERIVFTFNGTDSLNIALRGILQKGDHVITSVCEHNSVLRPLSYLKKHLGIEVTYVATDEFGCVDPAEVEHSFRPETKLVALLHASNVTGSIQPIDDVGELCRNHGKIFLVDAAQTAGHLPIDLKTSPVDLLATPGHKGLLGPLGTGILYLRPGIEENLECFRLGGTGTDSEDDNQPHLMPQKYESGNHNAPGLFGLEKALDFLLERGISDIRDHELALTERFLDKLSEISSIEIIGPRDITKQVGVVSIVVPQLEPQVFSSILDESFGIETRAGLHCAPLMHRQLKTIASGGTVRFSFGPFNTTEQIDATAEAIEAICAGI